VVNEEIQVSKMKVFFHTVTYQMIMKFILANQTQAQPISRCDQCGLTFRSFSGLYHHQKTHEGQLYRCPEPNCDKEYKTEHLLRRHLKVHRDHRDGNLKCPHCEKTFCRADYLEIHIKRHLGQKDEKCPECGKGFVCKSDLIRHKLNVHSAYGRYQCPDCGKRLRSNTSLNRHRQSRLCIKQLFPGTYTNGENESDIQYTYDDQHDAPEYSQSRLIETGMESSNHKSAATRNPSGHSSGHSGSHSYTSGHTADHHYLDNSGIIVENRNCSPLIQKQNPILNQTNIDHIPSNHDENTDLNLIDDNQSQEKFNDVLLSNQTLNSPSHHQSVIQETSSYLNMGHATTAHSGQSQNPHAVSGQLQASLLQPFNIGSHYAHPGNYENQHYIQSPNDFLAIPNSNSHHTSENQFTHTLLQSIS